MAVVIAILGLGEAGSAIAADLRAVGIGVRGYDPLPWTGPDAASAAEAADGADLVLSLTTAHEALAAAGSVLGALRPGQLYVDANTSSARLKQQLAELVAPTDASFADLALMAPVPGNGLRTPALASGPGADAAVAALAPLGMPIEAIGPLPGDAARRKLLRSVVWKGLAAAVLESRAAAHAAGLDDWMEAETIALLESADRDLLTRLVDGSRRHAVRRADEMDAAAAQLRELGVAPRVAEASAAWLRDLYDDDGGAGDGR